MSADLRPNPPPRRPGAIRPEFVALSLAGAGGAR